MGKRQNKLQCASPEHYTPEPYAVAIHYVLGGCGRFAHRDMLFIDHIIDGEVSIDALVSPGIDLDPCSSARAASILRPGTFFSREGEFRSWVPYMTWYCNPPGDPLGRLLPAFWRRCVEHVTLPDGRARAGIWAGYAYASKGRLDGLSDCPGPSAFPTVTIGPGAPCTTGGGRIMWISGETGQPQRAPQHMNYFTLLGGDDGQKARFREVFGAWGRYQRPTPWKPSLEARIICSLK